MNVASKAKTRSYGIVTDATKWLLIECTHRENERVTYRMTELDILVPFCDFPKIAAVM